MDVIPIGMLRVMTSGLAGLSCRYRHERKFWRPSLTQPDQTEIGSWTKVVGCVVQVLDRFVVVCLHPFVPRAHGACLCLYTLFIFTDDSSRASWALTRGMYGLVRST